MLQCLSHTEPITNLFLGAKSYKGQVNEDGNMGYKGKLVREYAKLMESLWCDGFTKIIPREFKAAIGNFKQVCVCVWERESVCECVYVRIYLTNERTNWLTN